MNDVANDNIITFKNDQMVLLFRNRSERLKRAKDIVEKFSATWTIPPSQEWYVLIASVVMHGGIFSSSRVTRSEILCLFLFVCIHLLM